MKISTRILLPLLLLIFSVSTVAQQEEMSACDVLNAGLGSVDVDRDGVENCKDNCVLDANRNQKDSDGNRIGDACEWRERQRKEWDESGRELRRQAREPVDLPRLIARSSDVVLGRMTNERWREPGVGLVIKVEVIRRFKDSTKARYRSYERPMWILVPDGGPPELMDELLLFLRNDKARQWRKPVVWPEPVHPGAPYSMKYFRYKLADLKFGVLGVSSTRLDQIERIVKAQASPQ
jgi:hypothetical protein